MSFINDLLEKPANLSTESKYAVMNGYMYLALGGLLIVWPGVVQTIFMDRPFVGDEGALFRVVGVCLAVIGWLYVFPTAGGVVFFGDIGGNFYALDAANGQKLWGQDLGGAIGGGVITYSVNGAQKVAVAAGFTHLAWPTKIVRAKIVVLGLDTTSASQ